MTPEEITALFAHWRAAWARHDAVALAAFYADNAVLESPTFGRRIGRAAIESSYHEWFTAISDQSIDIGEFSVTGDRVVQTTTVHGTDTGGLLGQAPTGNQFRVRGVILFDVEDGHIVHERRVFDLNGVLRQLATGHD